MKNKYFKFSIIIIAVILICAIAFIPKKQEENYKELESTLNDNGDLEIKSSELDTANATFINYSSHGVNMELVAIKDSEDNIDVAFNTCQVCNGSPKAYFVQKNGRLYCLNCGNTFPLSTVGASANGCNPITITDSNVIKTDTGITISKEFLSKNENLFTNVMAH